MSQPPAQIAPDGTLTTATLPSQPIPIVITATSATDPTVSANYSVQLLNPLPVISGATFSITPGASSYQLLITGSGFAPGALVSVNNLSLSTTQSSPSGLLINIPLTQAVSANVGQTANIQVDNPAPGPTDSPVWSVMITGPATNVVAATRILDQASFGPTNASIAHVQSVGLPQYIEEQLAQPAEIMPLQNWWYGALPAACMPFYQCEVDGYWTQFALFGQDQLRQRVAFALSKIWNASYLEVPVPEFPYLLNVFSRDAFANWRTLMEDVTLSEAMGTYLNMINSAAPGPGAHADENYARELMQLFSLGPNRLNADGSLVLDSSGQPVQTYTSEEVQGLALAFTGWTYANDDCSAPAAFQQIYQGAILGLGCAMASVPQQHDESAKTIIDKVVLPANQTAKQDLDQALDTVFNDSNLPPHVVTVLIQNLVTSSPSPAYISRVAQVFQDNGKGDRGDMAAVITAILLDPEARSGDDPTQPVLGGHLRDPISWVFAGLRALDVTYQGDVSGMGAAISMAGYAGEQAHTQSSVFGFYQYNYTVPGSTLLAPEFQLETPINYGELSNNLDTFMLKPALGASSSGANIALDLSPQSFLGGLAANGSDALLGGLNTLFFHGRMSPAEREVLSDALTGLSGPDMVRVGLYDVMMSPQFRIEQ